MVGVAGKAFTVTTVPADVGELQLPFVTITVYVPAVETVMDSVVAPFDQTLPVADDDVNTTLSPVQKVVALPALIVGVAIVAFTVTTVAADGREVQLPLVTVTV